MSNKTILLVEDNPDDVELTLRAFRKNNILNEVDVVRDGREALDYLFSEGMHAARAPGALAVVLLDLILPKIGGLEVLRHVRADARTSAQPVVILTYFQGRTGPRQQLPPRRQQLHPQTGGLRPVHGGGPPARALLAGVERATAAKGLTICQTAPCAS